MWRWACSIRPAGCALYLSPSTTCSERCPCCASASQSSLTDWQPWNRSYVSTATGGRRRGQRVGAKVMRSWPQQGTTVPGQGGRGAGWLGGDVWGSWGTEGGGWWREWETHSEHQAGRDATDTNMAKYQKFILKCVDLIFCMIHNQGQFYL